MNVAQQYSEEAAFTLVLRDAGDGDEDPGLGSFAETLVTGGHVKPEVNASAVGSVFPTGILGLGRCGVGLIQRLVYRLSGDDDWVVLADELLFANCLPKFDTLRKRSLLSVGSDSSIVFCARKASLHGLDWLPPPLPASTLAFLICQEDAVIANRVLDCVRSGGNAGRLLLSIDRLSHRDKAASVRELEGVRYWIRLGGFDAQDLLVSCLSGSEDHVVGAVGQVSFELGIRSVFEANNRDPDTLRVFREPPIWTDIPATWTALRRD